MNRQRCFEAGLKFRKTLIAYCGSTNRADCMKPLEFSREAHLSEYYHSMPLTFVGQDCSYGIDFIDPRPLSGISNYWNFATQISNLLVECVDSKGTGGKLEHGGFEFLVVDAKASTVRGTCLAPSHPFTMSLSACLASGPGGGERSQSRAGSFPGQHGLRQAAGGSVQRQRGDGSPLSSGSGSDSPALPERKRPHVERSQCSSSLLLVVPEANLTTNQQQLMGTMQAAIDNSLLNLHRIHHCRVGDDKLIH